MLITVDRDEDMPGVIAQIQVIHALRGYGPIRPPIIRETPWCRTLWPNPKYL
jgi:hypothetical protein